MLKKLTVRGLVSKTYGEVDCADLLVRIFPHLLREVFPDT